ncbi:17027_t:CDS:1, partial [Dentiscutata heterogama]
SYNNSAHSHVSSHHSETPHVGPPEETSTTDVFYVPVLYIKAIL